MGRDRGPSLRIESLSKAQPEISYLRTVISRFGGTIKEGTSVAIPPQTWDQGIVYGKDSFRSREVARPVCEVRAAGVPGYMGHVPHGRDSKRSPEGLSISTSTAAAQRFHATDYRALNRSRMPQRKLRAGPWERQPAPFLVYFTPFASRFASRYSLRFPIHARCICSQACLSWAIGGISAEQRAAPSATVFRTGALSRHPIVPQPPPLHMSMQGRRHITPSESGRERTSRAWIRLSTRRERLGRCPATVTVAAASVCK